MDFSSLYRALGEPIERYMEWSGLLLLFGKGSPPPPPDYTAAARAQGGANLQSTVASNILNRPDEITPLGARRWRQSGTYTVPAAEGNAPVEVPTFESITDLTPEGRQLYDQQLRISLGLGDVGEQQLGRVDEAVARPFDIGSVPPIRTSAAGADFTTNVEASPLQRSLDFSGAPRLPGVDDFSADRDRVTQAIVQRNQPVIDRQRSMLNTQLANQGIMLGSEAWRNAQDDQARQLNDFNLAAIQAGGQEQSRLFGLGMGARQQAVGEAAQQGQFSNLAQGQQFSQGQQNAALRNQAALQEFNRSLQNAQLGNTARQQAIQEQAYLRQLPLNELNAFRSGAQVNMPQFQQFSTAQVQPAPLFNATQAQYAGQLGTYNAQQAAQDNFTKGLFGLGSAALMSPWMSDRRLKSNIKRVGTHPLGIGIYEYDIFGRRERGVMADEVMNVKPEAISVHPSGYLQVDYGRL